MTKVEAQIQYLVKNKTMLIKLAMKLVKSQELAEDAVQEAAIKLVVNGDQLEDINKLPAFVKQTVFNAARNVMRGRYKIEKTCDIDEYAISDDSDPHGALLYNQVIDEIHAKVDELPETQKMVIQKILSTDDVFMSELAKEVGMPYNTFKANYRHCCLKLKEELGHLDPFDVQPSRIAAYMKDELTSAKQFAGAAR